MKQVLALLTISITIFIVVFLGLYSHFSVIGVLTSTMVISLCLGYNKGTNVYQILLWGITTLFETLLITGISQVNTPVAEQSIILAILMLIFIVFQICVVVIGLTKVFIREKMTMNRKGIAILAFPVFLFVMFLGLKEVIFVYLTIISIVFILIVLIRYQGIFEQN